MSGSMNSGCLSFFTPNHSTHAEQWLQKGSQYTLVCFACMVEIIDNKHQPSIRKTKCLHELLKLVSNGTVLALLNKSEDVLSHLLKCLWELMEYMENKVVQYTTVAEIICELCCALKSDLFVEKVLDKLTSKVVLTENVKNVLLQLNLLGKLLQNIPALTGNLLRNRSTLVSYLGKWTSYPDEDTRSALFFILTYFYRHQECCTEIPFEITHLVFRECCEVLTTATSKELQINSIALLQTLTTREKLSCTTKAITSNMETIITSLKKAFLSTVELVQTLAVGCLNNLVAFDESIISSDLPGFVFEVFNSKSDTLISLGFENVSRCLDSKQMYTKGHVVYGFDSVLSALHQAIGNKSIRILIKGFVVLRKIFKNCPKELVLISSPDTFKKCLEIIRLGLSICDDNVVQQATCCLGVVLDRRHFESDVPYGAFGGLVELVVKQLDKVYNSSGHWNRAENKGLMSSTVAATIDVVNKCLDLVLCERSKPPSIEILLASTEESVMLEREEFFDTILKLCDQICIPNVISNLRSLYDTPVPKMFFIVLDKLLQTCSKEAKYDMAKKFASSCFIRIALDVKAHLRNGSSDVAQATNEFLTTICFCLLPDEMREYTKNLLSSSLPRITGTPQETVQILKQNNSQDETLKNTQECIQILFYTAYNNGDRLIPRAQLLHALNTHLILNPSYYCDSSKVVSRCFTQLYITELCRGSIHSDSSPFCLNAQRILAEGLLENIENLSAFYFHDFALLEWAIVFEGVETNLQKKIIKLWFIHQGCETDINDKEISLWKNMVDNNPRTLFMLVSEISTSDVHAQDVLLRVIQHVLQKCNVEAIRQVLPGLKEALQKVFLNQAVEPLQNESMGSILKLLCMLVTTCATEALDEDYVKLVYHVVNFLTYHANSFVLCVKCLNFLHACMILDTQHGSDKVLSFLLNHQEYKSFLERAIQSFHEATEIERAQRSAIIAAVMVSISHLLHLQSCFGISTTNCLQVKIEAILPLLCHNSSPLLQFAANVFWESMLRCSETDKFLSANVILLFQKSALCDLGSFDGEINAVDARPPRKKAKVYLRMVLAYLQNSLLHVNMFIKLTALKCLEALLSLKAHAQDLIQDPWNVIMLRECKDVSSPWSLGFTMRLYSLFFHQTRSELWDIEVFVQDVIKAVLKKSNIDESTKAIPVPDLYLSALPNFFSKVIKNNPDIMTKAEKSKLKEHVQQLENYQRNKNEELEGDFFYLHELLVHRSLLQEQTNIQSSLGDIVALLDLC